MSKEITITLPDGSQKQAPVGVSGLEIANMIGTGLAKAAIAFSVNGEQRDLSDEVIKESFYEIQTKFEEKFDNAELAAESDKPSELATLNVLDIKFEKSRIKLKQRTDKDGKE